jgi:hypothetical protein
MIAPIERTQKIEKSLDKRKLFFYLANISIKQLDDEKREIEITEAIIETGRIDVKV